MAHPCWPALVTAALLAAWSGAASALTVSILGGSGRNDARDLSAPVPPFDAVTLQAFASPPFASGPVVAAVGASHATTAYTFTNEYFLLEFSLARSGNGTGGYARSQDFDTFAFMLDEPVYATVSGMFDVSDTGAGDLVWFQALLQHQLTSLHHTSVQSRTTPNESFVVGQAGGDFLNQIEGPTTNLLSAGVAYQVQWLAWLLDDRTDPGDTGATASGHIRIDFTPIPEPTTAALLAAGLAALGWSRRRA
jgi:hypothetical protein